MTPTQYKPVDVLVIGAGNAAANAALAAHEAGASVAMLETAPEDARGGNSAFTGGAFRFVYDSVDDLLALDPSSAVAYEFLGILFCAKKQFSQGLWCFNKSLEINPANTRIAGVMRETRLDQYEPARPALG